MDLLASGDGMGIGKTAEQSNLFDIGWPLRIGSRSEDGPYIELQGTDGSAAWVEVYKGHDGGVQRLDLKCGNGQIGINYDGSVFVNWDPIADIVIDQNTSGIWTYRKWKSGIAECWGTCSVTYKADFVAYEQTALPFSFPQIVAMTTGLADWNNDSTVTWDWNTRVYMLNNSSIVPMVYSPGRGISQDNILHVCVYVYGRWK